MHPLEVTHWTLVQKRTRIRHDKHILLWLQRCWHAASRVDNHTHSSSHAMTRDEFEKVYKRLLTAMTVEWHDEEFHALVESMWRRDAKNYTDLNADRFSCSIFSFAEMWVDSLEVAEYVRVLELIHRILSTTSVQSMTRGSNPTSLTAFLDALTHETQLAAMNLSIGKSTAFDPEQYARIFGRAVPEAVATMIASRPPKPIRRHSGTSLLPLKTPVRPTQLLASRFPPSRPGPCLAFVRMDPSDANPTTSMHNDNQSVAITVRSKAIPSSARTKPHAT